VGVVSPEPMIARTRGASRRTLSVTRATLSPR